MEAEAVQTASWFAGLPWVSDISGVAGLVITLVGFSLTLWKVTRSREEVRQMNERITTFNLSGELNSTLSLLDEIKRLHREVPHRIGKMEILVERYSVLKKKLLSIKGSIPDLSDEKKSQIQSAIQHFANMEDNVEKCLADETVPSNVPSMNKIVSRQIEMLTEILIQIRNDISR